MITKQILGIYVDRNRFHYVFAKRSLTGWCLERPMGNASSAGVKSGSGPQLLKSFLKELYPDRKTAIYLCLPRSVIYARSIDLPAMPLEDALTAIKNGLSMYAHLELSEIFYDVHIASAFKGGIKAILFYAATGEIEKYRQIFSETGHLDGLKAVFPLSYGVCGLFDFKKQDGHAGFMIHQEMIQEMVVYQRSHVCFSMTCPAGGDEASLLMKAAEKDFPDIKGKIVDLTLNEFKSTPFNHKFDSPHGPEHNYSHGFLSEYRSRCRFLPPIMENFGSAALAPVLAGLQQVSVDGTPVSIHFVNPVRYIVPFLCLLIMGLFTASDQINKKVVEAEDRLSILQENLHRLETRLEPLQQRIDQAEKESRFRQDVLKFMENRPDLYGALNAIAELVPEGTWFSSLTFNNDRIVLRGQGDDALKAVEALRTSAFFSNVMLRGSVNRSVKGEERFSVSLDLLKNPLMEKEKNPKDSQEEQHE